VKVSHFSPCSMKGQGLFDRKCFVARLNYEVCIAVKGPGFIERHR
jgi:hypothetical protein